MRMLRIIRRAGCAAGLAVAPLLFGQSVVNSGQSAPEIPAALRPKSSFDLPSRPPEAGNPFTWGDLELKPHLFDRFTYNDGILISAGRPTNTYTNALSAGLQIDLGHRWTLDYSPTWMIYTNRLFNNSVDQRLQAGGSIEVSDWYLQVNEQYSSVNSPRIETASQVKEEVTSTVVSLTHRFGEYLTLELSGAQTLQFIEKSPDNYDWSTQDWLSYRFAARLDFSIGYRIGYTDFDPGAFMIYSQPMARVRWRPTDKITFSATGGREHRKIHKHDIAAEDSPIFDASMEYRPFDHTKLTLAGNRSVRPSFLENGTTNSKSWNASLEQRLLGRLTLNADYSQEWSHFLGFHRIYIPNVTHEDIFDDAGNLIGTATITTYTPGTAIDRRNDAVETIRTRLSLPVIHRGTLAIVYQRIHNRSTQVGYSFTSNQIGCEFSYRF